MDLVTTNLVSSFRVQHGFPESIEPSTLFEHFANFCIASKEYPDEFDVEDISVAGGNDLQLDGVMIIVNGVLVDSHDAVDDLAQTNKYVDAEFIFVQAKTGSDFSGSEISNMFFGVRDLFAPAPQLPRNQALAAKEAIIRYIYTKSPLFKGNPRMHIYYVTTGKWQDDPQLMARIENETSTLEDLNIFQSHVQFEPVDAKRLQQLFGRSQNALTKTFTFAKRITIPSIEGVKEAYLGYIPAKDFIQLITDEDQNLMRGMFYENVRDFQGDNPVNKEIEETLKSDRRDSFVLLNNGITIVSEDLKTTSDNFTVSGFQIVNGCQTSHVLYNNRKHLCGSEFVSIKLVVAPNDVLRTQVIKATNRQTVVKTEELAALTDFQKSIERYYDAVPAEYKLYYERRSQQFRSTPGLEKIRIVNISTQIRTFASMFLNRAHQASRYYGSLLKDIEGSAIFVEGHFPIAYYVSSFALFRVESLLRKGMIENKYRPFKYHLLGILRMTVAGLAMPNMTTNKFEKYCETVRDVLWDDSRCLAAVQRSCSLLDGVLHGDYGRDKAKESSIQTQAAGIVLPEGMQAGVGN